MDTNNQTFVSNHFLYELMSPITRYVDAEDEYPELNFHGLDGNNSVEVKERVIRPFMVPWFHKWWDETSQQIMKNSLQYFLNQGKPLVGKQDLFESVISDTHFSFDPPTPARLFFVWMWEELFGPEDYHIDTRNFVIDDNRGWHLTPRSDPDSEHHSGHSVDIPI